ncbi:hypothetical protein [Haloarcula brevis]|uniref:hypothetical protein n=1 Tax=Haloarcula brevis TaxID=3111453 RepID=UPI00300EF86C
MDRDQKFEIQYLISLIVAVLGSLGARSIAQYVMNPIAHLFLLIVFIHIVAFNAVYTLRRATDFQLSEVDQLEKATRWTLYGISGLFLYLLMSILSMWLLIELLPFSVDGYLIVLSTSSLPFPIDLSNGILFGYLVPGSIVVLMGGLSWNKFMPALLQAQSIDISVVPEELSVFHDFDSTRPLHVNIENNNTEEISFNTVIEFPDEVDWKYRGTQEGSGTLSEETMVPGSGHEPYDIKLRYQGQERKTREVTVTIIMNGDTFSESVELTLEEY